MPGTEFGYTLNLKTLIPFKVQHPLPSIGLDLYQLGVHIRAKKKKKKELIPNNEWISKWNNSVINICLKHVYIGKLSNKYLKCIV